MRLNAITLFFALSFWSSGVILIRLFSTYHLLQNGFALGAIFLLTIPIVYGSVSTTSNILARAQRDSAHSLLALVAIVLALHGTALSVYPRLYGFEGSSGLAAAAWLLWFAAITLVTVSARNR